MKKILMILAMVAICTSSAWSQEDEIEGFILNEGAQKHLGISFKKLKANGPYLIPKASLIHIKHSVGVYRKWENHITMVLVKVVEERGGDILIRSVDLQKGDQVAISGISFLRMAEADINSDTVDSCSH